MASVQVSDLYRITSPSEICHYLSDEKWCFDYRIPGDLASENFGELLRRGWRRFGRNVFRPACLACHKCRPLRVIVDEFEPSKSQRRTLKRNAGVEVVVQSPSITWQHIRLYDAYHADMAERRGWPQKTTSPEEYFEGFIGGEYEFAREFLYFNNGQLVGVGLVDETPLGLSSAYFFHHPDWRSLGPGTFSVLTELDYARRRNIPHLYLGYWIQQNQSMNYKAGYVPHELLNSFVDDQVEPVWQRASIMVEPTDAA